MATPLKAYKNAILEVPTSTYGAWNEETLSYETQTVYKAYDVLVTPKNPLTVAAVSGTIDIETIYFNGRLLNPQVFDASTKFPAECKLTLLRERRTAIIEISMKPLSPFYREDKLLGTPFIGTAVLD